MWEVKYTTDVEPVDWALPDGAEVTKLGPKLPISIKSAAGINILTVENSGSEESGGVLVELRREDGLKRRSSIFKRADVIRLAEAILNSKGVDVLTSPI